MASRGSVIPLFIDQIRKGQPLTITDPNMTRFMMSLDDAVDLVVYAFEHGQAGDLFVQKAPAATIGVLAEAVKRVFKSDVPVNIIGTRHGEKLHETLLTREEHLKAVDLPGYFKVAADNRDLNYGLYVNEGEGSLQPVEDYNSGNTKRLTLEEMVAMLRELPYVKEELKR